MPISAIDSISPAFEHTKQQLFRPFRWGQWLRLGLVGLLAGELSGGGCNSNFNFPANRGAGTGHLMSTPPLVASNPALYAGLIVAAILAGFVLVLLLMWLSSVFRFILFSTVVDRNCRIRENWERWQGPGLKLFAWKLLFMLAEIVGLTILVGIPAGFAFAVGWLKDPRHHLVPLILGGLVLVVVFLMFVVGMAVAYVLTKDFVVPQMALENVSAFEGWGRLLPMLKKEKGSYAGYILMKIVMTIAVAAVVGVIAGVIILVMMIPVGGMGALAVLTGKSMGAGWNAYTITLAVVIGSVLLAAILYLISLVSVPATVFFPAYSIYFFAGRYAPLGALMTPAAAAPGGIPPPPPPPEPPAEQGEVLYNSVDERITQVWDEPKPAQGEAPAPPAEPEPGPESGSEPGPETSS